MGRTGAAFENKPFVIASTVSLFHVPLNMGSVFTRTWTAIREAHAENGGFLVLSHDDSAWHGEHLFAVSKPVAGAEMVSLSGDFVTKVFEGPYSKAREWSKPTYAKQYGKNYVVGVATVK